MKLFKIFILVLILISPADANTIYNLIKIPNLEIYKNNPSNGIKYLRAIKPFQVGIRNDNVTCFNSSIETLDQNFSLVQKNLNIYNSSFLKKINLKFVILCENLSVSEISAAGVPNYKMRTLILDIKFNKKYFERVIHHEVFHLINDTYKNFFSDEEWKKFNNSNFKYTKCSTCSDRLNLDLYEKTDGFLTEYSKSIPSEDMAEVFSFLMVDKAMTESKSNDDKILKDKLNFIKSSLSKIDSSFKF